MVTVEGAYAIAAIVLTLLLSIGAITAVIAQIRCTDAAREVARLAAMGDADAVAVGVAVAGESATVSIDRGAQRISATVATRVRLLPGVRVSATAIAVPEPEGAGLVEFAPGA